MFFEHDVELEQVVDYGINTENAWRTLERYLIEWEQAVGLPC